MKTQAKPERTPARPVLVYAVAGQGRGHAAKSLALFEDLKDRFDIYFFAGGEAYDFFQKKGLPVIEIPCLRFHFRDSAIDLVGTAKLNYPLIRNYSGVLKQIRQKLREIGPVLVISDFETFVPRAARSMGIPIVQVSHQVVLLACRLRIPLRHRFAWLKAWLVSRIIISRFSKAVGVSFFNAPILKTRTRVSVEIQPPIFRPEILAAEPSGCPKKHVLVYFSCPTFGWVLEKLAAQDQEQFIVYGLDPAGQRSFPNVRIKPISPQTFLEDLLHARGVITNGGHNLISEAIFLQIPVLSFWVRGQFEQWLNASYLARLGWGRMIERVGDTDHELAAWLQDLQRGVVQGARLKSGNRTIAAGISEYVEKALESSVAAPDHQRGSGPEPAVPLPLSER